MTDLIQVIVADGHPIFREGLVQIIKRTNDMEVIPEATTGVEAVHLFRLHQPDVAVMDLRMPEMDGVHAIATIRQEFPNACTMIISNYSTSEEIFFGLQAGARGYLLKTITEVDLIDAIRRVYGNQTYIPFEVGTKLAEQMSYPQLSDREREVLKFLGEGRTNQEVSSLLSISESSVKFHIGNIFSKFRVNDRTGSRSIL